MALIVKYIKEACIISNITVLLLLILELLARGGQAVLNRESPDPRNRADAYQNAKWVREYYREFAESSDVTWHPYVYFRRKEYKGAYINIDDKGIRKTWNICNDSSCIKIFTFGGSAMWGTGARDEYTIPSLLSKMFNTESNTKAHITNFGESGYVSTQEVIALMQEIRSGNIPDIVIFYDGVNDTFSALQSGKAGVPQNEENRQNEFNISHDFKRTAISLIKQSKVYRLLSHLKQQKPPALHEATSFVSEMLADEVITTYTVNIRLVENLAKAYGFKCLFYWQPTIFTKRSLTPFEQAAREEFLYAEGFYHEVYEKAKGIRRMWTNFYDISDILASASRPYFIDYCHISEAGNQIIARRMFKDIVRLLSETAHKHTVYPHPRIGLESSQLLKRESSL